MFSMMCCTNGGANSRYAGDLRRHGAHYDVSVMRYAHPAFIGLRTIHQNSYDWRFVMFNCGKTLVTFIIAFRITSLELSNRMIAPMSVKYLYEDYSFINHPEIPWSMIISKPKHDKTKLCISHGIYSTHNCMMTSWYGNAIHITSPLCEGNPSLICVFSATKGQHHETLVFSVLLACASSWIISWVNGDLRRHEAYTSLWYAHCLFSRHFTGLRLWSYDFLSISSMLSTANAWVCCSLLRNISLFLTGPSTRNGFIGG